MIFLLNISSPPEDCIAVEQNTQLDADHQNIAQRPAPDCRSSRAELREQLFKQPQKHRQQHTGVYGLCAKFSLPQVKNPMMRSTTFRIVVMTDKDSGTKWDSTMPRPEMLLTDVWLGTRKRETPAPQ